MRRLLSVLVALAVLCGVAHADVPQPSSVASWATWYWKTKQTHSGNVIFSDAAPGYVALTDAGYLAHLAAGNGVTTASLTGVHIALTALTATVGAVSPAPANGDVLVGDGVAGHPQPAANSQLSSVACIPNCTTVGASMTATVSVSQSIGSAPMTTTAAKAIDDGVLAKGLALIANLPAAALAVNPTVWTGVPALTEGQTALIAGCALTYAGDSALNATYETASANPFFIYLRDLYTLSNNKGALAAPVTYQARSGAVTIDTLAHLDGIMNGLINYRNSWANWVQNGGGAPTWGTCSDG